MRAVALKAWELLSFCWGVSAHLLGVLGITFVGGLASFWVTNQLGVFRGINSAACLNSGQLGISSWGKQLGN